MPAKHSPLERSFDAKLQTGSGRLAVRQLMRNRVAWPPRMVAAASEIARYFGASLVALLADFCVFTAALRWAALPWWVAAALGFTVGVGVAYTLSIRAVFAVRRLRERPRQEFLRFVLVGFAGLAVTQFLLWVMIERAGWPPEWSRVVSAVITFAFNYGVRKALIFSRFGHSGS